MKKITPKPFLKWVGGKTNLLKDLEKNLPKEIKNKKPFVYVEPFLGGGAMFFYLLNNYNIEKAYLNDINKKLISVYTDIKNNVEPLISILKNLELEYFNIKSQDNKKELYLEKRTLFNSLKPSVNKSALFIFLNKTSFNGMYRENQKGEFNIPFGKMKPKKICNDALLKKLSNSFKNVEFSSKSFEDLLIKKSTSPVFYYLDPPYRPISNTSSFKAYSSENDFNDSLQKKLCGFCDDVNKLNNWFMQSNSFSEDGFFQKLYKNYTINNVNIIRTIAADGAKRVGVQEILITNYE